MSDSLNTPIYGDTPFAKEFAERTERILLDYNNKAKEQSALSGHHAARALEEVTGAAYVTIMRLESRINALEEKLK